MKKLIALFIVFQFMVACGGSGGRDIEFDGGEPVTGSGSDNEAPIANAGTNTNANELSSVNLDGSGSSDPDDDTITYTWQQLSGTTVTLNDTNIVNPTFKAPSVNEDETLVFMLTVTNTSGTSDSDEVSIEIINASVDNDVIQAVCSACHYDEGTAGNTGMVFKRGEGHADYNETLLADFSHLVGYEYILSKARGVNGHGGGVQLTCDDEEFETLELFLRSVNDVDESTPFVCDDGLLLDIRKLVFSYYRIE